MSKEPKEEKKKSTVKRTLHYYWQEIVKYRWYSIGFFVATPIVVFVRAVLSAMVFANLIEKVSLGLPLDELLRSAAVDVIFYLVFYTLSKMVLEELRLYWTWKMEVLSMYDLANLCFNTVSEQSMQFHSDRFSGSLVSQTNKFVGSFERMMDVLIWDAWPILCYIIFVVIVLWKQAAWFAIGIVGFTIIYSLVSGLTMRRIAHLNDEEAEAYTKQTGQLADSISNIISVKSYAREGHERERFAGFSRRVSDASNRLMGATIRRDLMFNLIQIGITALILAFLLFGHEWFGISVSNFSFDCELCERCHGRTLEY